MDYTQKDVIKLIRLYRQYDCLWNFNSKDYKSLDKKREAWEHLSEECGKDVPELKRKIKYLRTAFLAEKRKVEMSKRNGDEVHEPHLFYFEEFSFLIPVVISRKTADSFCDNDLQDESRSATVYLPAQETQNSVSFLSQSPPTTCPSPTTSLSSNPLDDTPQPPRKRKKPNIKESKYKLDEAIEAIVKSVSTPEPENVYSCFGKTLAMQLQQLPIKDATETMNDIHTMVTRRLLRSFY